MRIFTGIPFPDNIKSQARSFFAGRLPVPYVNTSNLHITLNFFGELDTDQVARVKHIFTEVCTDKKSFDIVFDKVVAHHNRQIHLTLRENPSLKSLQRELEESFIKEGFKFQSRAYYPHAKIANMHLDNVMNRDRRLENFPNEELSQLNFTAKKIVLYESKLLLHHPKHIPLLEQKLM
jgi:2'-5' RNA ligase